MPVEKISTFSLAIDYYSQKLKTRKSAGEKNNQIIGGPTDSSATIIVFKIVQ